MSNGVGPVDALIADFRRSRKRLEKTPLESFEDVNKELRNNTYPSFIALAEQIAAIDEVITEVIEQQDSYIQEDLADHLALTFALAEKLAEETSALLGSSDDMTRARVKPIIDELEQALEISVVAVSQAAGEFIETEGSEEGDDTSSEAEEETTEEEESPDANADTE